MTKGTTLAPEIHAVFDSYQAEIDALKAERGNAAEQSAKLLDALAKEKPWCDEPWGRMALAIGARAIRRGRLLTDKEKLLNLADAMEAEDVDPEMREVADKIRAAANL